MQKVNLSKYKLCQTSGTYIGILDFKKWGKKGNLILYFTLDDGSYIWCSVWWNNHYLGLKEIDLNTKLKLVFKQTNFNTFYLEKATIIY